MQLFFFLLNLHILSIIRLNQLPLLKKLQTLCSFIVNTSFFYEYFWGKTYIVHFTFNTFPLTLFFFKIVINNVFQSYQNYCQKKLLYIDIFDRYYEIPFIYIFMKLSKVSDIYWRNYTFNDLTSYNWFCFK